MRRIVPILVSLLVGVPGALSAETRTQILSVPNAQAWTGDYDGMLKRRYIRILVVPSKTYFFLNKGETLGVTGEAGQAFEKWINKRHANGPFDIKVVFVPTRRDRIFQELKDGKGDIAAANLTITEGRSALVDFAKPWANDVKEVLVTGPSAPPIAAISDLSGQKVMVRASSSFHTHLVALNERLKKENHPPVNTLPPMKILRMKTCSKWSALVFCRGLSSIDIRPNYGPEFSKALLSART